MLYYYFLRDSAGLVLRREQLLQGVSVTVCAPRLTSTVSRVHGAQTWVDTKTNGPLRQQAPRDYCKLESTAIPVPSSSFLLFLARLRRLLPRFRVDLLPFLPLLLPLRRLLLLFLRRIPAVQSNVGEDQ